MRPHFDVTEKALKRYTTSHILSGSIMTWQPRTAAATVSYTDSDHVSEIEEVVPAGEKEDPDTLKPPATSEGTETRFGKKSEYFFQTISAFAQKYELHSS